MENRTSILKISLAGSGGVALGLVWGGLWLALNFFAYLGFDAMEDGAQECCALRRSPSEPSCSLERSQSLRRWCMSREP
jgi:hypothetical protein